MICIFLFQELEMPLGLLGGASIAIKDCSGFEMLLAIGGGNGSALPYTFVIIFTIAF